MEGLHISSYTEGIQLFLKYLTDEKMGAIQSMDQVAAIGFKTVLAKGYYGVHELTAQVIQAMLPPPRSTVPKGFSALRLLMAPPSLAAPG